MRTMIARRGWMLAVLILACAVSPILFGDAPAFSGGTGAEGDPYLISNALDLLELANAAYELYSGAHYRVTANIDAAMTRGWDDGAGLKPIGSEDTPFDGVFDGDGHVIENLYINRPGESYVGLFANIARAAGIYDLGVTGHVTGGLGAGGIAGYSEGVISNCFTQCAVSGSIYNEYYDYGIAGGIAGGVAAFSGSDISECFSSGSIRGMVSGGICGGTTDFLVNSHSSAWGVSYSDENSNSPLTGGVLGFPVHYYLKSVFSEKILPGPYYEVALLNTYSSGVYSCPSTHSMYGSVGESYTGEFDDNIPFWDISVAGAGSVERDDYARTTLQLTDSATFDGWDFATPVWTMTPGRTYPHLARTGPQDPQLLTLSVSQGGTVHVLTFDNGDYTPASAPYRFEPGTPLRLEAVADEGYVFAGWAGLPVITGHNEAALLVTLLYDATIAAQFVPETEETPYVRFAEAIRTGADDDMAEPGSAFFWGTLSPDVTDVRINGAALALNSILCAEEIYSIYTPTHTSGMRKWTWLSESLEYGDNVFDIEVDAMTLDGLRTASDLYTLTVGDVIPPLIILNGDDEMTVECGGEYIEPGYIASDNVDGIISDKVAVDGTVDTATTGEYALTYTVADSFGNTAEPKVRTVTVADTAPPAFALVGDTEMTLECGEAYTEPGAAATDVCDGGLGAAIVIGGDTVNPAVAGVYVLTYDVSDTAGNAAAQLTRTVTVDLGDPPVIVLEGAAEMTIECGGEYIEPGYSASDSCSGDLTGAVTVTGAVDTAATGSYTLIYDVTDAQNQTAQAQRFVEVFDTTPPELALLGAPVISLYTGNAYTEPGWTATDTCSGDLGAAVAVAGLDALDTATPGTYTLTYTVADPAGNQAAALTRDVRVLTLEDITEELDEDLETGDIDGDGRLSYEEAVTVMPGLDLMTFGWLDTNRNGYLEPEELNPPDDGCCGCNGCACDDAKSRGRALGDAFLMLFSVGVLLIFTKRTV